MTVFVGSVMQRRWTGFRSVLLSGGAAAPLIDIDLVTQASDPRIAFSRTSTATDGLYTDAPGSSFTTYSSGVRRVHPSLGLLVEGGRTNYLLNSAAPATQTTASLPTGTYCLWVVGTGSATSSSGTATATGLGTATPGAPNVFTVTVAGTITVTVSGALTRFQLENATVPGTFIPTTGAPGTRAGEAVSIPLVVPALTPLTLFVDGVFLGVTNTAGAMAQIDDGTNTNRLLVYRQSNGAISSNASGTITASGVTAVTGTRYKAAATWSASAQRIGCNGSAPVAAGSVAPVPGMSWARLGQAVAGTAGNLWLRRVTVLPREWSASEIQSRTA